MNGRHIFTFITLLFLATGPAIAQVSGLGSTTFENSGAPEAQEAFLRGILLLHSFEYEDAREAFVEARTTDPDFAMAYWGEAMTHNHPIWHSVSVDRARKALEKLGPDLDARLSKAPTKREKDYLRAAEALFYGGGDKLARDLAFMEAMSRVASAYPDDLDAAAFYALSILGSAHDGRDFATYMRAAGVAEGVFAANPMHPGAAHYLIHSYDDAIHAPLGLRAAHVYAAIAPNAAHALHMPSHIFLAMGMWDSVVESNAASFAASDERMERKGLGINARSFHARQWQMYGLLQQGRYKDARQLLGAMAEDATTRGASNSAHRHLALMRAMYLVETNHWDSNVARMEIDTDKLRGSAAAANRYAMGRAALALGDDESASQQVKSMMELKGDDEKVIRIMQHSLKAELLRLEGNRAAAIDLLEQAASLEGELPMAFGPPSPVKPSHELLGEFYLDAGMPAEAQQAFEMALARAPKRALSLVGLAKAAAMTGNHDKAAMARKTLRAVWHKADEEVRSTLPTT